MNSTLQALAHVEPLTRAVLAGSHGRLGGHSKGRRAELVGSLLRAYARLLDQTSGVGGAVAPRELKSLVGSSLTDSGTFNNYHQHDAHELLRFFLDALSEALNEVHEKPPYRELVEDRAAPDADVAGLWWESTERICTSAVSRLFRGQLRSELKCGSCGFVSRSFDIFEELLLQLSRAQQVRARMGAGEAVKLEDALAASAQPETLEGSEAWTCPSCKTPRRATKHTAVWRAPRVLIVVLKRFYFTSLRRCKIDTPVAIPRQLDITLAMHDRAPRQAQPLYELVACINHMGDTFGGHYTCDAKVGDGPWFHFNDSRVSPSNPPKQGSAPYILIYQRKD
jgi:ubiquitin carboxyl-terminal hydrolase 8